MKNIVVVGNPTTRDIVKNSKLSLKAKGLIFELIGLAMVDDEYLNKEMLLEISDDGRRSVTSAIDELKENGFLTIERSKNFYIWTVYCNKRR